MSAFFLASDFIAEVEFPKILSEAEKKGLKIIWIPISDCLYNETDLEKFHSAIDPSTPLISFSEAELEKKLSEISAIIRDTYNSFNS